MAEGLRNLSYQDVGLSLLRHTKPGWGTLTIPKKLMKVLPDEMLFRAEFTDEGILLRPVDAAELIEEEPPVPAWVPPLEERDI